MLARSRQRNVGVWLTLFGLFAGLITLLPAQAVLAADHSNALVPQQSRLGLPKVIDGSVRSVVQVGDRVVMGGDFTQVEQDGVVHDQPYLAAYFIDSGLFDTSFDPVFDKSVNVVRSSEDGTGLFVGGLFSTVDGQNKRKVAKLTAGGTVVAGFTANAPAQVQALAVGNGQVYVGGNFKKIKGQPRLHLASVNADTGQVDGNFNLPLTGAIGRGGGMNVFDLDLTADGATLLVVHTASQIDGQDRVGAALIDVSGPTATLLPWRTALYQDELPNTGGTVQITGGALSPDGSYFVTVATGGDNPPTNDSAVKFSTAGGDGQVPVWVSRHFDSIYAVDIADTAVYVGGHFQYQEAPGSTDPFPGDPDVNYGFGAGLGPAVLGDEVVAREQLGALHPGTGKSLDWDPGASGFHGVESVTVIDRGLLIGHDGSRIGGREVGRSGLLDFQNDLAGSDIDTILTEPRPGRTYLEVDPVPFAGTAIAPAGVDRVQIEVQDVVSKQWLRRDGTMGSYQNIVTDLAVTGATTADWSYAASLPVGEYRVTARVFDLAGQKDPTKASIRFTVSAAVPGTPPETELINPGFGIPIVSNTITFSGRATDDVGIGSVGVSFYDTDAEGYLHSDGSIGSYESFPATLLQPGAPVSDWEITQTLPNGTWRVVATAIDVDGTPDPSDARRTYVVQPGNAAPTVALSTPVDDEEFTGDTFTLTGTAQDDVGVRKVRVHIRNEATFLGPLPNGFVGFATWIDVPVSEVDGTDVTWTYTTPALPPGRYRIQARAVDALEAETPGTAQAQIYVSIVVPGDNPPDTELTSLGSYEQSFVDNTLDLQGIATDDVGVAGVFVTIYDNVNRVYIHSDGTPGLARELLPATVGSPGATTTSFSYVTTLPDSTYRVGIFAQDTVGQLDPSDQDSKCLCLMYPGNDDPTTQVNSPVDNAVLAVGPIVVGGRVRDTESVADVEIWIREKDTKLGPRRDGTIGAPQWIRGFLTNPGGTGSDFSYTSIPLPAGRYLIQVRAIDSVGQQDLVRVRLDVDLE